jgi:hypothetical protein
MKVVAGKLPLKLHKSNQGLGLPICFRWQELSIPYAVVWLLASVDDNSDAQEEDRLAADIPSIEQLFTGVERGQDLAAELSGRRACGS